MSYVLEASVVENVRLPRHNYLLAVRAPEVAATALPGQFVMAAEVGSQDLPYPLLKRALAVFSTLEEKGRKTIFTVLLKTVGEGTRRLAALQPGDSLSLIGPLGQPFRLDTGRDRVHFLVAGGIGIASLYLPAEQLKRRGEEVHLVYGGRTADDLVLLDRFEKLGIPSRLTTEDGSRGQRGRITEGLLPCLEDYPPERLSIYTCGPNPMMQAVTRITSSRGISCQISVEAKMACGFGVCLGCSVKTIHSYKLACRQGPVFDAAEFVWEDEVELAQTPRIS